MGIAALFVTMISLTGCARSSPGHIDQWMAGQPRLVTGPPQERAEAALAAISFASGGRSLKVTVFDSEDVGAYCWPSGNIELTRGLLELVDDQELIAAIAHEVGHLLADGHLPRHAALAGCESNADAETEADLAARALLKSRGLPEDALVGLLQKVAAHPRTTPACRERLNRRAARLLLPH